MDNGHKGAIFSSNPEMGNDLNTENWQESLKEATPAGMPAPEELGTSEEIATTEDAGLYSAEEPLTPDALELGQIIPATSPSQSLPTAPTTYQDEISPIRIDGDRMSESGIEKVDRALGELGQDRLLSPFYDKIRGPISKEAQDAVGHINTDELEEGKVA